MMTLQYLHIFCPALRKRGYDDDAFVIEHWLTHEPWWRHWVFHIAWAWTIPGEEPC